MKITSSSKFRKDIKRFIDEVDQDQEPLVVTRSDNVSVVVLPLATYNSYTETEYLLRSPANAERLRRSIEGAKKGKSQKHNLLD